MITNGQNLCTQFIFASKLHQESRRSSSRNLYINLSLKYFENLIRTINCLQAFYMYSAEVEHIADCSKTICVLIPDFI